MYNNLTQWRKDNIFKILPLTLIITFFTANVVFAGFAGELYYSFNDTDTPSINEPQSLFYFFDLRDRDTFIQLTAPDFDNFGDALAHIQIFDVSNNCNENNFADIYTPKDTHVYNMRNIQTNDGNPSGVVLPDNSYGIVAVTMYPVNEIGEEAAYPFGNMRIIDNNGYEYRTNAVAVDEGIDFGDVSRFFYTFNFNQEGGVNFSDIVGVTLLPVESSQFNLEWIAEPVQKIFTAFDIDIVNNNEVIFSCRDIVFSCVDNDNPLLEELLTLSSISVASFEYGINNTIPHSKDGELLCPGNNIGEGTVKLRGIPYPNTEAFNNVANNIFNFNAYSFAGFVGLNNGNKRGSFDSFWIFNDQ